MTNGTYWNAETSLVQVQGSTYRIVATCTWGFGMENDKFMMYPMNWGQPSQQHINQMFNQYGIKLIYP